MLTVLLFFDFNQLDFFAFPEQNSSHHFGVLYLSNYSEVVITYAAFCRLRVYILQAKMQLFLFLCDFTTNKDRMM